MSDITTLNDRLTGKYKVTTMSSTYIIDLDSYRAIRFPGAVDASTLRGDHDWFDFIAIDCSVDQLMGISSSAIAIDPEITTFRWTTRVVSIEEASL